MLYLECRLKDGYLGSVSGVVDIQTIFIRDIVKLNLILPVLDVVNMVPEALEAVLKDGAEEAIVVI